MMLEQSNQQHNVQNVSELTQEEFWDNYWGHCVLPAAVDPNHSFERCLAQALKKHLKLDLLSGDVFEIGCAPGKWLAFMAKEFGLIPHGIEYSHVGMKATLKNFELLGLNSGLIQTGDFFQKEPDRLYDVVMSFGFIEHFSNVDDVVESHLKWLKPNGILILGVPNFCGIYKIIQKILNNDVLEMHNLEIMNLKYFNHIPKKFNLTPQFIGYLGSFEPVMLIGGKDPQSRLQVIINIAIQIAKRIRKLRVFDKINSRFFSSYILSIYQKNNIL